MADNTNPALKDVLWEGALAVIYGLRKRLPGAYEHGGEGSGQWASPYGGSRDAATYGDDGESVSTVLILGQPDESSRRYEITVVIREVPDPRDITAADLVGRDDGPLLVITGVRSNLAVRLVRAETDGDQVAIRWQEPTLHSREALTHVEASRPVRLAGGER